MLGAVRICVWVTGQSMSVHFAIGLEHSEVEYCKSEKVVEILEDFRKELRKNF
jgi:hypothetical protein